MTETLAVEWAKFNIKVNAIAPGLIRDPQQLDSSLLYLVAPSSSFVTGTCIKVDNAQLPR
jgi:NAD(P)-dependent dehydrogenase (short-subunit alcohol dehydrogenase family)